MAAPREKASSIVSPQRASQSPEQRPSKKSPSQQDIELAAYELYLQRGCVDGHAVEDWLQAEQELTEVFEADVEEKTSAKSA
jgi:hypothetical protein